MDLGSLELKIARSENLPVLPQIVSSVLKLVDDPTASSNDMVRIVERDPGIAAKILRVANSSFYGLNQVASIGRAISILGVDQIRSLVVAVSFQQLISAARTSLVFSKLDFWRHSLAVATGSRILGKLRMPTKAEELYGAGMMHDVGILVMDRFCPEMLDQAIKHAGTENSSIAEAERKLFGYDHSEIGALLAEKWSLTPMMEAAIRFHHDPFEDSAFRQTTTLVAIADILAHQCGFQNNSPVIEREIGSQLLEEIDLPPEQLDVIKSVMVQEIQRSESAFNIAPDHAASA